MKTVKRILPVLLALSLLCTLTAGLSGCSKAPSGFTRDGTFVTDNETPFAYDPDYRTRVKDPRIKEHLIRRTVTPLNTPGLAADAISAYSLSGYRMFEVSDETHMTDEQYTLLSDKYDDFVADFGSKCIRTSAAKDGRPIMYTVYCEADNEVTYVFLGQYRERLYVTDALTCDITADAARLTALGVTEQDLPAALLPGLPSRCLMENADPLTVARRTEEAYRSYTELCDELSLPSVNAVPSADGAVKDSYRCLVLGAFGNIPCYDPQTQDGGICSLSELTDSAGDAAVCYDLMIRADGTGLLTATVYQINSREYPFFAPLNDLRVTAAIPADEVTAFLTLLDACQFKDIPTWNPAAAEGVDGIQVFFSDGRHLISQWEATPYFGIYQFRSFLERLAAVYGRPFPLGY